MTFMYIGTLAGSYNEGHLTSLDMAVLGLGNGRVCLCSPNQRVFKAPPLLPIHLPKDGKIGLEPTMNSQYMHGLGWDWNWNSKMNSPLCECTYIDS